MKLNGKTAIVTGSSFGIGRGIALRFAAEGAKVVVNYHSNEARAAETLRLIEQGGGTGLVIKADVGCAADVEHMVAQTLEAFGGIDILVNNAGLVTMAPLLEMTEEDWDRVIDTNLKGVFLCTRSVAREMVRAGHGGKIVNISSVHSDRPQEQRVHYAASKAGILNMAKVMALELAPYKINVNSISPGAIETGMGEALGRSPEELERMRAFQARTIPWGRVGLPKDVASLALFLVTDEADYCTGANFVVDGGLLLVFDAV
jgi:NAD(P)-dependent dehydrogenase (short-subunit alcohol dehydrogenase family)